MSKSPCRHVYLCLVVCDHRGRLSTRHQHGLWLCWTCMVQNISLMRPTYTREGGGGDKKDVITRIPNELCCHTPNRWGMQKTGLDLKCRTGTYANTSCQRLVLQVEADRSTARFVSKACPTKHAAEPRDRPCRPRAPQRVGVGVNPFRAPNPSLY